MLLAGCANSLQGRPVESLAATARATPDRGVESGPPQPGTHEPTCQDGQLTVVVTSVVTRHVGTQIDLLFTNRSNATCGMSYDVPVALVDANGLFVADSGESGPSFSSFLVKPGDSASRTIFWKNWCQAAVTPFRLIVGYGQVVVGRLQIDATAAPACIDPRESPRLQPAI